MRASAILTAVRLTDIAANANPPRGAPMARSIYFLSNRSGSNQVWRMTPGTAAPHPPGGIGPERKQITNLPLDVGSFRVSPKGDRVLVSMEVFIDCADLACTKQRLDGS
jgi:hypothetical protein